VLSPISHHWFDSTHIAYGVVTAGVKASAFQIEGSAFNGREPDEKRWDIDTPRLDRRPMPSPRRWTRPMAGRR
jgi:hypothetical protein